jgi:hypothetical protein
VVATLVVTMVLQEEAALLGPNDLSEVVHCVAVVEVVVVVVCQPAVATTLCLVLVRTPKPKALLLPFQMEATMDNTGAVLPRKTITPILTDTQTPMSRVRSQLTETPLRNRVVMISSIVDTKVRLDCH